MTIEFETTDASRWPGFAELGLPDLFALEVLYRRSAPSEPTGVDLIVEHLTARLGTNPAWTWQLRVFTGAAKPPNRLAALRLHKDGPWSMFSGLDDTGGQRTTWIREYDDGTQQALGFADMPGSAAYFAALRGSRAIGTVRPRGVPDTARAAFCRQPVQLQSLLMSSLQTTGPEELVVGSFGAFDDVEHGFQFLGPREAVSALGNTLWRSTTVGGEQ